MGTAAVDERLEQMRRQVEELEAKGQASTGEAKSRIQRQVGTLRQQEATARAAAEQDQNSFDEKFQHFEARYHVAQSAVAADLSESRNDFADAVDDELHKWDGYLERLQAQTVMRTTSARERAESAIRDLRQRRNEIAERVTAVRNASGDDWHEQKKRIGAARDELEQKADELSAKFD
jgi:uncharacterized protein YjbJ (UPF0337 family)